MTRRPGPSFSLIWRIPVAMALLGLWAILQPFFWLTDKIRSRKAHR